MSLPKGVADWRLYSLHAARTRRHRGNYLWAPSITGVVVARSGSEPVAKRLYVLPSPVDRSELRLSIYCLLRVAKLTEIFAQDSASHPDQRGESGAEI